MRSTSLIAIGPSSSVVGRRHPEHVGVFGVAVVRRPVEQAVGARDRDEHPDAALGRPRQEVAGVRLVGSGEVGRERAGVEVAHQIDEVLRQGGGIGRAARGGLHPAALAQLRAQRALASLDVFDHAASLGRREKGEQSTRYPRCMAFIVTKAVIPVAGLGTRFLPATKAMPKEMLPVVDKPAIQYVVEEAVAAGLHRRADGHRPQQDRAREPLRPGRRARGDPAEQGRRRQAREGQVRDRPGRRALRAPGRPEGPRPRGAPRQDARRARAVRRSAR